MKKIFVFAALFLSAQLILAQEEKINTNKADFELGKGLRFSFDNGDYQFKIGGFIQPSYTYSRIKDEKAENRFRSKRSYFNISGKALKEKVSFFIQTDFSLDSPLLDAWVAYHPTDDIRITFGQKRTFTNSREMTYDEDVMQFTERSMISTVFSDTGREFGLYAEGRFQWGKAGIMPQIAITSGDGRNSFGSDSRDTDKGGLKYGGRLDVYPLGYFSEGNTGMTADLMHESSLKMVVGAAASYNDGASNAMGEGHGDFALYNEDGKVQLPDYRKVYADILLKYQGFSLLGEYANTSATGLDDIYINEAASLALAPQQISSYLLIGDAWNTQLGYATLSGYALDLRYTQLLPEFKDYSNSLLQDTKAYTIGFSKYFKNNAFKLQTSFSKIDYEAGKDEIRAELLLQVVF
ncbi:Phosphate-selective porin O and P [Sinomicrobium oceani]|uniref:Phosphate-selective porin O and P n=1 Tax=Sinomicrobium oceani TaxID=1150368 RepID=A0A1K1QG68_9FLAO|nr:porin [Sinomicrobium oceani]SFW58700.1 Phosphate-selective porin O and P [Sinomicrobium oceani]